MAWALFVIIFLVVVMGMAISKLFFAGMGVAIVALIICAVFISRTSTVKTQWTLDEKGVEVNFLTQGTFVSNTDQGWSWDEIADFELFEERNYDSFKFTFADNTSRKYYVKTKYSPGYKAFIEAFQLQFGDIQWRRPPAGIITELPNANID